MITQIQARDDLKHAKHSRTPSYFVDLPANLTLLHITHWKAGSQWFRGVLEIIFGPTVVTPDGTESRLFRSNSNEGVYPCVYLSPNELTAVEFTSEVRKLIVIRDLRDTLISGYFSLRNSHPVNNPFIAKWRNVLAGLTVEEGLLYVMDHWLNYSAMIQKSWNVTGTELFHFEELLNGHIPLQELFRKCWKINIPEERLRTVEQDLSFSNLSGGREPGVEDNQSHYRKGMAGDWRNYFTSKLKTRFLERHGELLIQTGYEKGTNW